jgi:hypothetical protein
MMVFGYLAVNSGVARMLDWLKRKASPAPSEHSLESKEQIPLTDVRLERMLDRLGSDRSERREPVAETLNKIDAPPSTDSVAGSERVAEALNEIDPLPSADSIMAGERAARALNEVDPPLMEDWKQREPYAIKVITFHSGRPLSEIIAETVPAPATPKRSEPECFGHPLPTDASEAAPEPSPEPTLSSTSERALQSTAQSVPPSTPEPMLEGAALSSADRVAQKSGDSAAGKQQSIQAAPDAQAAWLCQDRPEFEDAGVFNTDALGREPAIISFFGEPVPRRNGEIRWFVPASRRNAARRSPIIRFCIAFCGAVALAAIGGVFFLYGTSETDTTISASYFSISSNTRAAAGRGAEPQTAVAAASASQTEPVDSAPPIPSLATNSNSSSEAPIPRANSVAVAAAESTPEAAPTPAPTPRPEEVAPIVAVAPGALAPDTAPVGAMPAPTARPEEVAPIVAVAPGALAPGTAPAGAMPAPTVRPEEVAPIVAVVPDAPRPDTAPTVSRPAPAAPPDALRSSAVEVSALLTRGDSLLGVRDVTSARLYYERAANAGDAQAALRLGETYDPSFLALARLNGVRGDPVVAARWYRHARDLGNPEAEILLKSLHAN